MQLVYQIHFYLRWVILLVAVIALVKFAVGWFGNGAFKGMDRGLVSGFSGLLDLQALLGIIYFIWNGFATQIGFPAFRWEHGGIMLVAVLVGHLPARWKKAADKLRFRNSFLAILGAVVLILIGVYVVTHH